VTSIDSFQPWLDMVRHFPIEVIDEAWKQIPPTWIEGEEDQLQALLELLLKRRSRVEQLVAQVRETRPAIFPNWK
jgi:hypothetical protein